MRSIVAIPLVACATSLAACGGEPGATTSASTDPSTTATTAPDTTAAAAVTTTPATTVLVTTAPVVESSAAPRPPASTGPTLAPTEDTMPAPNDPVSVAIADLAQRLGVDASGIEVVSVEEVDWPDGSLGCPMPGMSYTQMLVNGSRIVLARAGVRYEYHSGGGRDPFYCPPERATP